MIINKIKIDGFGAFSDRSIEFKRGFNLVYGENEGGKSTLMAFIKMMFYSKCGNEKSSDLLKNTRRRYIPWSGAAMSGEIGFECDGHPFSVRKNFKKTPSGDTTDVRDAESGEKIVLSSADEVGSHFLGMNVSEFERSAFIDCTGGISSDTPDYGLATRIANLSGSGDETVSQKTVCARIAAAREELISKNGKKGLIITAREELSRLVSDLHAMEGQLDEYEQLSAEISKLEQTAAELESRIKALNAASGIEKAQNELNAYKIMLEKQKQLQSVEDKLNKYSHDTGELEQLIVRCRKLKADISDAVSAENENRGISAAADADYRRLSDIQAALGNSENELELINTYVIPAKQRCDRERLAAQKKFGQRSAAFLVFSVLSAIAFIALGIAVNPLLLCGLLLSAAGTGMYISSRSRANSDAARSQELTSAEAELESAIQKLGAELRGLSPDAASDILKRRICEYRAQLDELKEKYGCGDTDALTQKLNSYISSDISAETERLKSEFTAAISNVSDLTSFSDALSLYSEISGLLDTLAVLKRDMQTVIQAAGIKQLEGEQLEERLHTLTEFIRKNTAEGTPVSHSGDPEAELRTVRGQLREYYGRLHMPDGDIGVLRKQIPDAKAHLEELETRYEILTAAAETMDEAARDTNSGTGAFLNRRTGEYLAAMTDGKYRDVAVSKNLDIETRGTDSSEFHQWKYMSAGTIDRIYLALRLASADVIASGHESIPIFLDDILSQYDAENCRRTLEFLNAYLQRGDTTEQIIFFTCHRHIADAAKELIPDLNEIKL